MCRIGINLTNTTPNGTNIVSAIGQYRLVGSATWINFPIILNNPETPNLTVLGSYELRLNVTNNVSDTSEWSNISTFQISSNCNPSVLTCDTYVLGKWAVISNFGTISVTYIDCDGVTKTESTLTTTPITFCAKQIISYDLGGDIPPENTPPLEVINSTADTKGLKGYLDKTGVDNCTEVITGRCEAFSVTLDGGQGDGGTIDYVNCDGIAQVMTVTGQLTTGTIDFCSIGTPIPNGDLIIGGPYAECINGNTYSCYTYELYANGGYGDVIYEDCTTGNSSTIYLDGSDHFGLDSPETRYVCSRSTPTLSGGQGNPITITRRQICN